MRVTEEEAADLLKRSARNRASKVSIPPVVPDNMVLAHHFADANKTMDVCDALGLTMKDRPAKYRNVKTMADGWKFDSIAEARYYRHLKNLQSVRKIKYFLCQVPFRLPGRTTYYADFMIVYNDGHIEIVDVKGVETETFKLKKRQVEDLYPVTIKIVKGKDIR